MTAKTGKDDGASDVAAGERATSVLGMWANNGWWAVVGAVAVAGAPMAVLGLVYPTKAIPGGAIKTTYLPTGLATLAIAAALAVIILLSKRVVRRAAAAERRWAAALPFALEGHLGYYGTGFGIFELTFDKDAPDEQTLASLVAGVPGLVFDDRARARIRLDRIDTGAHARCTEFHRIVDKLLLPMHGRYPLAAVRFR